MSDLAQRLREARAARGFSLAQAEQATKIRGRYLDAIESGDFVRLPDGLSARGFIKNYSRWLGMDYIQALADFETEWGVLALNAAETIPNPPSRERIRSKYTEVIKLPEQHYTGAMPSDDAAELDRLAMDGDSKPGTSGTVVPVQGAYSPVRVDANGKPVVYVDERRDFSKSSNSFKLGAPRTKHFGGLVDGISTFVPGDGLNATDSRGRPRTQTSGPAKSRLNGQRAPTSAGYGLTIPKGRVLAGGAGILLAALLVYGVVSTVIPGLRGLAANSSTPVATSAQQSVPVDGRTAVLPDVTQQPVHTPQAISLATTVVAPAIPKLDGGGMQLTLDARERAWVRVRVDGKQVFEGIAPIGPNSSWHAATNISVETGNAGAFDVIVNGVRLGAVGARNSVAKLIYDTAGIAKAFAP